MLFWFSVVGLLLFCFLVGTCLYCSGWLCACFLFGCFFVMLRVWLILCFSGSLVRIIFVWHCTKELTTGEHHSVNCANLNGVFAVLRQTIAFLYQCTSVFAYAFILYDPTAASSGGRSASLDDHGPGCSAGQRHLPPSSSRGTPWLREDNDGQTAGAGNGTGPRRVAGETTVVRTWYWI